jgi:SAM-dependent methyltransferase
VSSLRTGPEPSTVDGAAAGSAERPAVDVYQDGLRAAGHGLAAGWLVRYADGTTRPLRLAAWSGGLRPGDRELLRRCAGPTLDIGCGPGRLTAALAASGVAALGVDIAGQAVALCRARGGRALRRDVFGPLPGEGRWRHALLADGNVGIGGDPAALLRRCAQLVRPGGTVLCETDSPGTPLRQVRLRIEPADGPSSGWFDWAHLGPEALAGLAAGAGFDHAAGWGSGGRWFSELRRR